MASFKFAKITTFRAPVTLITPGGEEQEFTAEFVYLDDKAWLEKQQLPTVDFLRAFWTGWRGIVGEDGAEIAYSDTMRDALLDHNYIAQPVVTAYSTARAGRRAKN